MGVAAALAARLQTDPAHHIGYLGTEPEAIAEQLRGLEPRGLEASLIVRDAAGSLVGLLAGEWDTQPPRVWWHGPLIDADEGWDELADALRAAALLLLPPEVVEEELAPDQRNTRVAGFAQRHGFERGVASAVLSCSLADGPAAVPRPADVTVRPVRDGDRAGVAQLHDRLFPGTHTPGARLGDGNDRYVLVARRDGVLVGYAAAEQQEDGQGYLDYVGVEPTVEGSGVGAELIVRICEIIREQGSTRLHLTVREDNIRARRLYGRLGFTEERILVPWRRGVTCA